MGVALTKCYFCNESNEIILHTRLTPFHASQVEKLNGMVINMNPCQKCEDLMKRGVILITIDNEKSAPGWEKPDGGDNWMPNPYRTGGWFVVTDDATKRMFTSMADWAIKHRFIFIEHEAAKMIGLFDATPEEAK